MLTTRQETYPLQFLETNFHLQAEKDRIAQSVIGSSIHCGVTRTVSNTLTLTLTLGFSRNFGVTLGSSRNLV